MEDHELLTQAQSLIRAEAAVIAGVADQLDATFIQAARWIGACSGRIITTGAGTSGAMAHRMAHLMATCSLSAFYITPGDALHGESALLAAGDLLIALSKAGKSADINQFATIAHQRGAKVISLTANPDSDLATLSDLVILLKTDVNGEGEGVLPFGSTLANGALGDALCLLAKQMRGFDLGQLTQTHPSGGTSELVKRTP